MIIFLKWIILLIAVSGQVQANSLQVVAAESQLLQYPVEGKAHGPSADILRLLLDQANLDSKIEFMPWSRAFKTALTEPNTLVMTIIRTPEREDKFYWIAKVSDTVRSFISRKDNGDNTVATLTEAKQKITAVVRGSSSHHYLLDKGFSDTENLYLVSDMETAIKLFLNKKIAFVFTDPDIFISYYAAKNLNSNDFVSYSNIEETRKEGYIALSKPSDPNILKKLVAAKKVIEKTQKYHQLVKFIPLISIENEWYNPD